MRGPVRHFYPTSPQQVRFRVDQGRTIRQVTALRSGHTIQFQQQDANVSFEAPGVADYEVIALV